METPWFGDGSIKQVPKVGKGGKPNRHAGKWRLQWTYEEDKLRIKVDKLFATKAEASKWRDDEKVRLKTGVAVNAASKRKGITLQALFEEMSGKSEKGYLDGKWVEDGTSPLTVATRAYRWNKWVKESPIAHRPVRLLDRDDTRAMKRYLRGREAPIPTQEEIFAILRRLVNNAIQEKKECKALANPFLNVSLQTNSEKAVAEMVRLTNEAESPSKIVIGPAAAAEGLCRIADLQCLALIAVHLLAGLRLSEGMALCVSQIDFVRNVIVVDRAVHLDARAGQFVGLPKGNKIRLVAMCPALAAILREYAATLKRGRKHLFGQDRKDKPLMKYRYYELWQEAMWLTNLPKGMSTQDCRLSHNNWIEKLMPSTVSLSTRLEHMGHSLDKGDGVPSGVAVNITNYTAHIPEAYAILGQEIEKVVFEAERPQLRVEEGGLAA